MNCKKKILVTGCAGFIGYHLTDLLLIDDNFEIIGLDIITDYYDVNLKFNRLRLLGIEINSISEKQIISSEKKSNFKFIKADLSDYNFIVDFIKDQKFDYVVNLAAQAGVRYSIEKPLLYSQSNITGFLSILEGCRQAEVKHLIYASTSSVYGLNAKMPLNETMSTDHPMSFYAATKKANEIMAHSYSHLFNLPTTGLRFFTVYGPWGRPDMALFLFADAISKNNPINVFNHGKMVRDFTYVYDIVKSIKLLLPLAPNNNINWDCENPTLASSSAPYLILNIGNSTPTSIEKYISALENELGRKAIRNYLDIQPGDVVSTHADTSLLKNRVSFSPNTSIEQGIKEFVKWYREYFNV
jgi:UDP-glucuronate 4-epimerase